jgi:pyruvate dehydrogenase E2 component (dihydrolipoamide acetyltransferase)
VNVSVNDLVIKSAALALRDVPEANALWNSTTSEYKLSASIDISVAVATPNGLITPIIKNVDGKGLTAINAMVK